MKAANNNRTKMYRIRRKLDGRFLVSMVRGSPNPAGCSWNWSPVGAFFLKQETIRKHLLELCQVRKYDIDKTNGSRCWNTPIIHLGTDYSQLNLYEVVIMDISVIGQNTMEAVDFASFLPVQERLKGEENR